MSLFPVGFTIWKNFGSILRLDGQVYHYRNRYWRVHYSDQNSKMFLFYFMIILVLGGAGSSFDVNICGLVWAWNVG